LSSNLKKTPDRPAARGARTRLVLDFKYLFAVVTAVFLGLAGYTALLTVKQQAALRDVSRYNLTWMVTQAALQVDRFTVLVGAFAQPGSTVDADNVSLGYDLVVNQVSLFEQGAPAAFVDSDPELRKLANDLHETVLKAQTEVDHLEAPGAGGRLLALLIPLNSKLPRIASAAYAHGGTLIGAELDKLNVLHWVFSALVFASIACGVMLMLVGRRHYRLLQRAHAVERSLVEALQNRGDELAEANRQARQAMAEINHQNRILQERDATLHVQNARFDAALNNMSQALCMVDVHQRLIVCNSRFCELFGLQPELVSSGDPASSVFDRIGQTTRFDRDMVRDLWTTHQSLVTARQSRPFYKEDNKGFALAVSHQLMADGGWVATYEDVTERRRVEAQIRFMAHHDALTGLPNRILLKSRMDAALHAPTEAEAFAVLFLDLDDFKKVNDTLGHAMGDVLLEQVARRLAACLRDRDLVARIGGDEFAILQFPSHRRADAELLAQRIIEVVCAPYELDGHVAIIGLSIGIALAADNPRITSDFLLRNADLALYRAKAHGGRTYRFFEPAMNAELQARRMIELDLRNALHQQQFELVYQPVLDVATMRIGGFEALLRWHHPTRGIVYPGDFISVAEETGLIVPIGEWVLREACALAATWPDQSRIAVNLSPVQLLHDGIVATLRDVVAETGIDPRRLELEITETALLNQSERVLATLYELRSVGVRTVLDDFGTGYSSLSYLRSFPFDAIKIDQSFVREIGNSPDCLAIVESMSDLAVRLGMTTTAEGVETLGHFEQLRQLGYHRLQGYYIGVPTSFPDAGAPFAPQATDEAERSGGALSCSPEPAESVT